MSMSADYDTYCPKHDDEEEIENMNVTINEVSTTTGTSAKGDWTRYIAKTSGGQFQTFDHEIGHGLHEGQTVDIEYKEEKRGDFTNKVIQSIKPISDAPANIPNKDRSICYSYAKDIVVALINRELIGSASVAQEQVVKIGDHIFNQLSGVDDLGNLGKDENDPF